MVVWTLWMNHAKNDWVQSTKIRSNGARFNRGKWMHNCRWNRMKFLRYDLGPSVIWNSCQNHPSLLSMRKICARWVLKLSNDEHKWNRVVTGLDFMFCYHDEEENLFDQIVTGANKWVHHFTPNMNSASQQWVAKNSDKLWIVYSDWFVVIRSSSFFFQIFCNFGVCA